ncbi:peroxidase family protein [Halomonas heilongjiangensis]|uniref:Oxygenase n=1 Tax=Halomonas heilongjiangensis TaxID=1387883 RepID=A0A2N7TFZ6_9GAMM|nr:peroxidase family protein [Halomonas heilongjiangensis]PMR67089.1 oxygenase [Halomonas heilongjiangensis]PXX87826.1 oxygenase [Halomonas heilongjiangensis]
MSPSLPGSPAVGTPSRPSPLRRHRHGLAATALLAWLAAPGAGLAADEALALHPEADKPSWLATWSSLRACKRLVAGGLREVPDDRADRFLGKVQEDTALCRGGKRAVEALGRDTPWVDWQHYWATGAGASRNANYDDGWLRPLVGGLSERVHLNPNDRGIDGALIDLEYQRVELIKFNLFDNATYRDYVQGRDGAPGSTLTRWAAMRLPPEHPEYQAVGGDAEQLCRGELIRHRTLTGICNDLRNPLMGATGTLFARNVEFAETFPDAGHTDLTRARHGDRLGPMTPDPQRISRELFTREQSRPELCNQGRGLPGHAAEAHCDYHQAPFFNVLAAFWIQFMTHDWFSHLNEGENDRTGLQSAGCRLPDDAAAALGCRPGDAFQPSLVAQADAPEAFDHQGKQYLTRAHRTFNNHVTAWWDASQLYGYDEVSASRVKRDPEDPARLQLVANDGHGPGYLPRFGPGCDVAPDDAACERIHPAWAGQEAAAFPDNWTVGMAFYHNVFAREHNAFVAAFREQAAATPDADSGLRDPAEPARVIRYRDVTDDELFEAARLVVAAMIAKIHTIEWTPQLLYDEPLYRGMNSNWSGLFHEHAFMESALSRVLDRLRASDDERHANAWYSVLAAGPGIFGLGSERYADGSLFAKLRGRRDDIWSLENPDHVNGGINHFGSPFNFPEEFITVYRLHPLVPDLLEVRDLGAPDRIHSKVPALEGFRAGASDLLHEHGLADWALSMGRQRLGLLTLGNHGQFLQNLDMPHLGTDTGKLDIAALDIIRDRERGVPRFNEFRRQYGLKQLTGFDDFIDARLPEDSAERRRQEALVAKMREVYGQHVCDAGKVISHAQRDAAGHYPDDCLGHPDGTLVDNIEDVDAVVGWLAEPVRPHGFAISETQFVVFILNASRRLFSDRFFTSSFRPEFYTQLGHDWVMHNGPDGVVMETATSNGHRQPVSPMKRVLQRTVPELAAELDPVVNVFDPWARARGDYYSLEWTPRPGAENDDAFAR